MKNDQLNHQVALTLLDGVGAKYAKLLLAYLGSAENIFENKKDLKISIPGFAKERFRALDRAKALNRAEPILNFIEKHDIKTVFFSDKDYPKRLKECGDSPILMYYKGNFDFNKKRTIAIVGTRNMTDYGRQIINELLTAIAPYDVQVVSGLAHGVDGYTHQKCLELGISTIGVLGHGLDRVYPAQNRKLAIKMMNTEGCGLLTEFPNNTNPDRENFPQRNRIVAGMVDATIVIESNDRGGSLITALLANDYNREVFAFPGNIDRPYSRGCNQLIAQNKAQLVTCGADIIRLLNWEYDADIKNKQFDLFEGLEGEEKSIAEIIKEAGKISMDLLALKLKKPTHMLSSLLLSLELKGVVMSLPGQAYSLSQL
ncbi:MAG TPA: DNA-processing protein DprA [Brumimicrobium sp.]|nr:DNA-processing protein DprA [Brumimicrobium sp.]